MTITAVVALEKNMASKNVNNNEPNEEASSIINANANALDMTTPPPFTVHKYHQDTLRTIGTVQQRFDVKGMGNRVVHRAILERHMNKFMDAQEASVKCNMPSMTRIVAQLVADNPQLDRIARDELYAIEDMIKNDLNYMTPRAVEVRARKIVVKIVGKDGFMKTLHKVQNHERANYIPLDLTDRRFEGLRLRGMEDDQVAAALKEFRQDFGDALVLAVLRASTTGSRMHQLTVGEMLHVMKTSKDRGMKALAHYMDASMQSLGDGGEEQGGACTGGMSEDSNARATTAALLLGAALVNVVP